MSMRCHELFQNNQLPYIHWKSKKKRKKEKMKNEKMIGICTLSNEEGNVKGMKDPYHQ